MNGLITAAVRSSDKPVYLHGPVSAIVTVTNTSSAPVSIQLAYPVPEILRFETRDSKIATAKPAEGNAMARTVPIALAAGASYTATYFLNRYFTFHEPGQATIDWHLTVPFKQGGNPTATPEFQGSFRIQLVSAEEHELRAELAGYAAALQSRDRRTKLEAAEALAFLDTPLSAEYVLPMLAIEDLEIIGIDALGRNSSRKYDDRFIAMLSHPDSGVVGAALEEIDRRHIPVNRSEVQRLLSAQNPNVQWLALGWLAQHPSEDDLPLLPPLVASSSQAVRDRAKSYELLLRSK